MREKQCSFNHILTIGLKTRYVQFFFGRPVLALTLSGYGLVIFLCKNPPALFIGGFLHKQSFIFLSGKITPLAHSCFLYDFSCRRNYKVLTFYKPIKIGCYITKAFYACIQIPFSFHIFPRSCTYNVY